MNVGLLNRVNTTKQDRSWTMYSEWTSLLTATQVVDGSNSVLNKFPGLAGKEVVTAVVKHLAQNLGINNVHCDQSNLESDRDVQWCMEVICFGLSLHLTEHETIKDCVNVYCEWLGALRLPKSCVPKSVCDDPNIYARKMIQHLYNLFKPRSDMTSDTISKQAVLCHRVLRVLQQIAQESTIIARETWETLLLFLLGINDMLLGPPAVKDDIGDHMCERVISVLFEIWLLACARCFPNPPMWKTFQEMSHNWRHRPALIEHWNRINFVLTSYLLKIMYGADFPELKISEDDAHLLPPDMTNDCIAQSWFRFLHTIHNPVDLCQPKLISQTPKFLQYAISCETVTEPSQHPCLAMLPHVFLKAMKGIATLVDSFLGISQSEETKSETFVKFSNSSILATPPQQRRIAKSFSVSASSAISKGHQKSLINIGSSKSVGHSQQSSGQSSTSTLSLPPPVVNIVESRHPLAPGRPKCNSILHLFGTWLFEASLIGTEFPFPQQFSSLLDKPLNRSAAKLKSEARRGSVQAMELGDGQNEFVLGSFEAGKAEAIGALCRVFCAKKTGEEILPVYLARFYLAMRQGLIANEKTNGQVLSSVLFNSCDLLRIDLDGVQVLVPHILGALELVLPDKELKFKVSQSIPIVELRRASINLLLSMLPLPLHFRHLTIKEFGGSCQDKFPVTFQSLRSRLVNLLINTLQCEMDSTNTQLLLAGLLLSVNDAAAFEEAEQLTMQTETETSSNLCSGSFHYPHGINSNVSDTLSSNSLSDVSGFGSEEHDSLEGEYFMSPDSAHALFLRATYLVCHRLISSWKTDLNVSLAALELLAGFAKIKIREQDAMECKRAVKWICDYIVNQCSRPPPAHSKDLHSTIVAAFHCVTVWLVEHPYLLEDKECLNTVLEVVELGISGSKSQAKHTDIPCMKSDKESKPASMRVRDAAEAALGCIMEQVGAFPSPCGPESLSSLLNEETLLQCCNLWAEETMTKEIATSNFRYFVLENAHILGLLEQPLGNDQDPQPTVTLLIRGPFGRHAWTMQHRHLPRHKSGAKCYTMNPGRPLPLNDTGVTHDVKQRYFPESVDRIPQCKAEKSIPSLDSLMSDPTVAHDCEKLNGLMDKQIIYEKKIQQIIDSEIPEYPNPETECKIPSLCQEFQTARLFLSQFGFLSLESLKESLTLSVPPLISLSSIHDSFASDVEALDHISSRTYDTVCVFYVKSCQKTVHEILGNVQHRSRVNPVFMEFLLSLGWPVDVRKHPGWTGQMNTSWKINFENKGQTSSSSQDHGGSLYNGEKQILYWADFSAEMAFIVPSLKNAPSIISETESIDGSSLSQLTIDFDRSARERRSMPMTTDHSDLQKPRTLSLDLERGTSKDQDSPNEGKSKKFGRHYVSACGCDMKVVVVWLESFEDHINFPLGEILQSTGIWEPSSYVSKTLEKDAFVIFIHTLQSGLFRVHMPCQSSRSSMAIPLIDGMVVSRRVLGTLIRQTALNMCRRRRLENEGYQPPHVRRNFKIQEIVTKYRQKMSEPEFYTSLFSVPPV